MSTHILPEELREKIATSHLKNSRLRSRTRQKPIRRRPGGKGYAGTSEKTQHTDRRS